MAKESKSEERKSPPNPHGFKDKTEQAEYIKKQKKGEPEIPLDTEDKEKVPQEAVKKEVEEIVSTEEAKETEETFDVDAEIKKAEEAKAKAKK